MDCRKICKRTQSPITKWAEQTTFRGGSTSGRNVRRRLPDGATVLLMRKRFAGCTSHHPTLRDVFPLHDEGPGQSMLPGAMGGGIGIDGMGRPTCPAVKRLERECCPSSDLMNDLCGADVIIIGLVHIELAAYSAQSMGNQARRIRYDCSDCQTSHQVSVSIFKTRSGSDPVLTHLSSKGNLPDHQNIEGSASIGCCRMGIRAGGQDGDFKMGSLCARDYDMNRPCRLRPFILNG
jgi:hypothetical protein